MKVLMFGWEFPPHITGGLGTACYGLSQSLSHLVTKITFVLPKIKGTVSAGTVEILGASGYTAPASRSVKAAGVGATEATAPPDSAFTAATFADAERHFELLAIDSPLKPYDSDKDYTAALRRAYARRKDAATFAGRDVATEAAIDKAVDTTQPAAVQTAVADLIEISGDYGKDLLAEIRRYAHVAGQIAIQGHYDLIHAHDWMTFLAGVEAKRRTGLPLVLHVHALEFDRSGEHIDQRIYDIERYGMEHADHIIAVSSRTKDMIIARYDIPAAKITVVHNGVMDKPKNTPRHEKKFPGKLVCFLGRITMQKGPEYFLEAAYLVSRKVPNVHFVMGGSGDMLPRMTYRMAELRLLDRFHFTGFLNEEKRHRLFSMADVFVMTSISEPFGITPVEAIQHDVPVIVTKQCGVAEVLRSAIKADFWDVRKIADAIIKVLTEDSLARQIVEGARQELTEITWERSAAQVHQVYSETRAAYAAMH